MECLGPGECLGHRFPGEIAEGVGGEGVEVKDGGRAVFYYK